MNSCENLQKVKQIIRTLLLTQEQGLSLRQLNIGYQEYTGKDLPYAECGFQNSLQLLNSMPDVVQVNSSDGGVTLYSVDNNSSQFGKQDVRPIKLGMASNTRLKHQFTKAALPSPKKIDQIFNSSFSMKQEHCTNNCDNASVISSTNGFSGNVTPKIPVFEENLFKQILLAHPRGISAPEFAEEYLKISGNELDLQALRYSNVITLASDHPEIFEIKRSDGLNSEWFLFDSFSKKNQSRSSTPVQFWDKSEKFLPNNYQPQFDSPRYQHGDNKALGLVPVDAATFGHQIQPQSVPDGLGRNEYFQIYLSEVDTPESFWFTLSGETTSVALAKLMAQMNEFYNQDENFKKYVVRQTDFKEGLFVAAKFGTDWHRAQIVGGIFEANVKVKYVDYGTIATVNKDALCYLPIPYTSLPYQAIKGKLYNITYFAVYWEPETLKIFFDFVNDKLLMASIMGYSSEHGYSLILCDCNGTDDIFINDYLVLHGLAIQSEENKAADDNVLFARFSPPVSVKNVSVAQVSPPVSVKNEPLIKANQYSKETFVVPYVPQRNVNLIKEVILSNNATIHIVKHDQKAYILSVEIANFIKYDTFLRSFQQLAHDSDSLNATKKNCPDLFVQLKKHDLLPEDVSSIPLMPLSSLINLINPLNDVTPLIKQELKNELVAFSDPCWPSSSFKKAAMALNICHQEVMELFSRRMKILNKVTSDEGCSTFEIEELEDIKTKFFDLTLRYDNLESEVKGYAIKKLQDFN